MSHHTWLHRISRSVIVRPLRHTPITPNQLTALRLATGVGAALGLALGDGAYDDAAAGLFVVSILFDRADGDLARQMNMTSETGHTFDMISDTLCNALIFVGLGFGVGAQRADELAVPLGLLAGLSVVAVLLLVMRAERHVGRRAGEIPPTAGFDADDAMLVVPLAIWLGASHALLYAAAVGTPLFAIFFYIFIRRKLRATAA